MPESHVPVIVPMLNLQAQYAAIRPQIDEAVARVLSRQNFILGEEVAALEREIAVYCGVPFAVGVASGTDALLLALKAAGVGPGDEVIVPAFSFIATADTVSLLGARPVFADIDPITFNLDPRELPRLITPATRAIIPVHLYGSPADMEEILHFAAQHNLAVIGDGAQALGSRYQQQSAVATGDYGCLSFFPSKNLGAYGDGGMILAHDKLASDNLRMLRSHGSSKKYYSDCQGWNSRLDELQAAVLRVKLPLLDSWNSQRAAIAGLYAQALAGIEGVTLPTTQSGTTHVFHQYTLRVPCRDQVQAELLSAGIQTAVHYPVPMHLQRMYQHLGYKTGDLPHAEQAAREVLSLPIYPELTSDQVERISLAIRSAVNAVTPAFI